MIYEFSERYDVGVPMFVVEIYSQYPLRRKPRDILESTTNCLSNDLQKTIVEFIILSLENFEKGVDHFLKPNAAAGFLEKNIMN